MTGSHDYNPLIARIHGLWMPLALTLTGVLLYWLHPAHQYTFSTPLPVRTLTALTAQFSHLDASHLLLNLTGLYLVCWGLNPWRTLKRDVLFTVAGLAGVAAGLLSSPEIAWYRGLSGCLHGLFCGYACLVFMSDSRGQVRAVAALLLAGAAIKLALEDPALLGANQALEAVRPVLHAAHRWGAVAGVIAGMMASAFARARSTELAQSRRASAQP